MEFTIRSYLILAGTVYSIYNIAHLIKAYRDLMEEDTTCSTCPCCGNTYDGTKGAKLIILRNGEFLVCLDCFATYSNEDIKEKIRKRQTHDTMLSLIVTLLGLVVWTCFLILSVEV